jgi:hypothetical protein
MVLLPERMICASKGVFDIPKDNVYPLKSWMISSFFSAAYYMKYVIASCLLDSSKAT